MSNLVNWKEAAKYFRMRMRQESAFSKRAASRLLVMNNVECILNEYISKKGIVVEWPMDIDDCARAVVEYANTIEEELEMVEKSMRQIAQYPVHTAPGTYIDTCRELQKIAEEAIPE